MGYLQKVLREKLPPDELDLLPKSFTRIGHVAVLHLPQSLRHRKEEIVDSLLRLKGVRTVAAKKGGIKGRKREPDLEVIGGDPNTETIHRENGCYFKLDPCRVMFSPGNLYERRRIPELIQPGEVVVDLFAGIGQFSIPIAKLSKVKKVYAVELNPTAYRYLSENIRLNHVGSVVEPIQGDCEKVAPRGIADRVLLGILHVTHKYLPLALEVLKPSGGIIHYHESVPLSIQFKRPIKRILSATRGRKVKILGVRRVKKYSPNVVHVVVDAYVE